MNQSCRYGGRSFNVKTFGDNSDGNYYINCNLPSFGKDDNSTSEAVIKLTDGRTLTIRCTYMIILLE